MTNTSKSGIYQIINITTQKQYIGSAVRFKERWYQHRLNLRRNTHHSQYLQNAWNKYGEEDFVFRVIEEVEDRSKLLEREQHYLDTLKPEYNASMTAGSRQGMMNSDAHKARIKAALNTPESQEKLANRPQSIYKTEEYKDKMKEKMIGNTNGRGNLGNTFSSESRAKMRAAKLGTTHDSPSEETKEKIRQALTGSKRTEESRAKMSQAKKEAFAKRMETYILPEEKLCKECQEVKPRSEYYSDKTKLDQMTTFCKNCHKAKVRQRELTAC